MPASQIITLGIGTPAAIDVFILVGLEPTGPIAYTPAPSIRTFYPRELRRTLEPPGESRTFYPRYDPSLDGAP